MLFPVIIKNLNKEILTKNLITFKMGWGLKKKTLILWGSLKRGGHQNPIYRGNCLKRGAWTVCKWGLVKKKG